MFSYNLVSHNCKLGFLVYKLLMIFVTANIFIALPLRDFVVVKSWKLACVQSQYSVQVKLKYYSEITCYPLQGT